MDSAHNFYTDALGCSLPDISFSVSGHEVIQRTLYCGTSYYYKESLPLADNTQNEVDTKPILCFCPRQRCGIFVSRTEYHIYS